MARFVLIDHSICDLAGHHYQYAVHVLEAAERAGYEPVLITNRKFKQVESVPWKVLPVYEFGFWPEHKASAFLKAALLALSRMRRSWFDLRCKARYSTGGLVWLSRTQWREHLRRRPAGMSGWPSYLFELGLVGALKLLRTTCLLALIPVGLVGIAGWTCWRVFRKLLNRAPLPGQRYFEALISEPKTYREFLGAALAMLKQPLPASRALRSKRQETRQRKAFERDTQTLLERVPAGAGDIFFIPTISPRDMLGLSGALRRNPGAAQASWHLLFRRNIYRGSRGDYDSQESSLDELRVTFQAFRQRSQAERIFFYTDTDELTYQYDRLGIYEFHTLPIPHTYSPGDRIAHRGPVRITYLGDARREKGFHLLPQLVADLACDYLETSKACFVVQCNYNVPGGEPEAVIARAQLESYDGSRVKLYKEPLNSAEYKELLLSADINLLLYEAGNYYARSSGILVESLAAGIPVIVPAGTWLARWFLGPYYRHQETLLEKMEVLSSHSQASLRWWRHGFSRVSAIRDGEIEASFEGKAWCWLKPPDGATHLLVRLKLGRDATEATLYLSQLDRLDLPLEPVKVVAVEAEPDQNWATCLFQVLAGAHKMWFAVGSSHKDSQVRVPGLKVDFMRTPEGAPAPTGAVGLIYQDASEISGLVRDMINNYAHYSKTAHEFAEPLRNYHNPDRLILELGRTAAIEAPRALQAAV